MLAENFPKKKIIKKKIEYMNQNNNDTILRKEKNEKTTQIFKHFKTTNIKIMSFICVYFFTELKIYLLSHFYLQTLPYQHC